MKIAVLDYDLDSSEDEPGLNYLVEAAAKMDIKLELIPLPETRAHRLVQHGELDGEAFPYEISGHDSSHMIKIDVPIESSSLWIWVPETHSCPSDPNQLSNFKPVGLNGIPYFGIFYQLSEVGFEKVSTPHIMVKMLRRHRADYFPASKRSIEFLLDETDQALIKPCFKEPFITITSYFYLNEKHHAIAEQFKQKLAEAVSLHSDDDDD
ncbi:hypothetical protein [Agarivorans litoreus]|uniref:hypothetical protein n=1 Tax=Agarivorans litoreus TaxID=1510455 RepID=UPI001C7E0559|nr:hypothetical protein [Agarivorans litoreus]